MATKKTGATEPARITPTRTAGGKITGTKVPVPHFHLKQFTAAENKELNDSIKKYLDYVKKSETSVHPGKYKPPLVKIPKMSAAETKQFNHELEDHVKGVTQESGPEVLPAIAVAVIASTVGSVVGSVASSIVSRKVAVSK